MSPSAAGKGMNETSKMSPGQGQLEFPDRASSRGMGSDEMKNLAGFMARVLAAPDDGALQDRVAAEVKEMCSAFPPPGIPQ